LHQNYKNMENEEIKIYEHTIREDILKHIDDLREKISNNVYFPEGKQDIQSLIHIDDSIDECLNCWYY